MTRKQKEELLRLGICYEWILDGMEPAEFKTLHGFNVVYVQYVKEMRGIDTNHVRNLLDPKEDSSDITAPAYVHQPDSFHSLEDGTVDVCVTVNLNPTAARFLEGMLHRLPLNFPNHPRKQNLGYILKPMIMDAVKNDGAARNMSSESGTMTGADFAHMKGPQR